MHEAARGGRMHVEHFMTRNPVACEVSQSVQDAAALMREKGVGSVVVLRDGRLAGVVTDRQLACRVVAEGMSASDTKLEKVMTAHPARLTLDDNLFSALDTLRSAGVVRRAPVVNDREEVVGMVSLSDLAVIAKDLIDAILLEEIHHALQEARIPTGAKRIGDRIGRPTRPARSSPREEIQPVTTGATPAGAGAR